jgi:hypothetical protein
MQDTDGNVPFFWGTDSEGHLVLSDDKEIVTKGCGRSFAPFPKGIWTWKLFLFGLGKWLPT